MNIFKIEQEYLELAGAIIDNDGVASPEQEKALALNQENLELKAVNYCYVIKQAEDESDALDKEIKRLTAMKKARTALIDRLKDTVKNAMILYDIKKIEMRNIKLYLTPSTSVVIFDESLIPKEYEKREIKITYPLKAIGDDLKKDIDVPGASLSYNQNLQIK